MMAEFSGISEQEMQRESGRKEECQMDRGK